MKGKITRVSSFGGIQLDNKERWYNPATDCRMRFDTNDVGKEVDIFLNDDLKYTDKSTSFQKESVSKVTTFDSKSLDIHRQVALKCAVDYLKDKNVSTHNVLETAEELEKWLNR